MKVRYYFDMDGVLCDWVKAYKDTVESPMNMPLEKFNAMSRSERAVLKQDFFTYDFFHNMKPIRKGMDMLHDVKEAGYDVGILSATGKVNKDDVIRAKQDWVRKYIGNMHVDFVDKVEMKSQKMFGGVDVHILIDDRPTAIEAWRNAGGIGILFK